MSNRVFDGLSVLVVEDDSVLRKQITAQLERLGADVVNAGTLAGARQCAQDLNFDLVFLDVHLPDGLGTELLQEKRFAANAGIVVMTAHGGVAGAVEAMRLGALDYLVKPFDPGELPMVIGRVQRARQSARLNEHQRGELGGAGTDFFFGQSLAPLEKQLEKILHADHRMQGHLPPVLIQGETGTGKTSIARWLHQRGPRAAQPLVELNCSALPETLAESELFGHERGAFTDARTARIGLFEAAHGGTLFLDELPSLPVGLQAKILTAIEDHRIRRLGGNREIPVDVRVIAATARDLRALVSAGQFREDLYQRLDLYRVVLPPLRARGEDILRLAERLMDRIARRHRLTPKPIHRDGCQRLLGYSWPGNVRELAHEIERAIVFEERELLQFDHLPCPTPACGPVSEADWFNSNYKFPPQGFDLEQAILRIVQHAMHQTGGNVSGAARLLGVTRDYLRYRLEGRKE